MAAMPEDMSLASQCLDFCQMLAGKSLSFSFSLSVGNNFSFSVESRGKGALSSPTKKKKKKKPTPSTVRQNARRREEFLRKKLAPPAEKSEQEVSEKETPGKALTLQHLPSPSPSSERRKVITVGREKEVPTFSQLDGAPPVAAAKPPSHSSAASSPVSPPSQPDEEYQGGEGAAPGDQHQEN